jgi:hypothetical protein
MKRIALLLTLLLTSFMSSPAQEQPAVQITDKEYEAMLQGMADKVLYKFNSMPSIRFVLKDDPYFYKNGKLHALAFYTRDERGKPVIYVNPAYHKESKTLSLTETVFHELIHAWVDWKGLSSNVGGGHNEAFLKKAIEFNLELSGTLATFPEAREIYDRLIKNRGIARGKDDSGLKGCEPWTSVGCFGKNIYQYQFFDQINVNEYKFKESRLFIIGDLPKLGSTFSWQELFPGKTWRVHSISGSVIQILEVKVGASTLDNCNPSKISGCYGENIYSYQFISNAYESSKMKFIAQTYLKTSSSPRVGKTIKWRDKIWKCYAVTGSILWFTEAFK